MDRTRVFRDLLIPAFMMGGFGLFYWAIRGTGGFGGSSGAMFVGLGWAACWYYLSNDKHARSGKPYGSGFTVIAIIISTTLGGLHGYGQFLSWIRGTFRLDGSGDTVDVNPAWGWMALVQCGLCWGGVIGLGIGWTRSRKKTVPADWFLRIAFTVAGALVGYVLYVALPQIMLPLYNEGYYSDLIANPDCLRTMETARSSAIQLGAFFGLLAYEFFRKDWRNVKMALLVGGGFAAAFSFGALWFFETWFPNQPSWKSWEMTIGCGGGVTLGFAFFLFNGDMDPIERKRVNDSPLKPTEMIVGVNFAMLASMAYIVYNTLNGKGLLDNFFSANEMAPLLLIIITIAIGAVLAVIFVLSGLNHLKRIKRMKKHPSDNFEGSIFRNPAIKFILVQVILAVSGILISMYPVMSPGSWYLIINYIAGISVGFAAFGISLRLDDKKTITS